MVLNYFYQDWKFFFSNLFWFNVKTNLYRYEITCNHLNPIKLHITIHLKFLVSYTVSYKFLHESRRFQFTKNALNVHRKLRGCIYRLKTGNLLGLQMAEIVYERLLRLPDFCLFLKWHTPRKLTFERLSLLVGAADGRMHARALWGCLEALCIWCWRIASCSIVRP